MKRMLNRMLRYADAIVKRGVDKLIDTIAHSAEPQTKNTETPQPQKRMGNDTDCAPQTTGNTTDCGITLMDEQCDISYNVLDRTPEVQWRDQADKGFVPVSKLVRNTMVIAPFNGADSDGIRILWCSMRFAANAENYKQKKRQKAAFLPYLCREVCATVCLSQPPRYFSFAGGGGTLLRLLKNTPTWDEATGKNPTRDASPPLERNFLA